MEWIYRLAVLALVAAVVWFGSAEDRRIERLHREACASVGAPLSDCTMEPD